MPLYDFRNKETGEIEEHFVHLSERDEFLKDHPNLEHVITAKAFQQRGVSNIKSNIDTGFKEVLNKVREAHPLGTVRDQS